MKAEIEFTTAEVFHIVEKVKKQIEQLYGWKVTEFEEIDVNGTEINMLINIDREVPSIPVKYDSMKEYVEFELVYPKNIEISVEGLITKTYKEEN